MPHHKRRRPKSRRAGCLMCKPWKVSGVGKLSRGSESFTSHKRRAAAMRQIKEAREPGA